MRNILQILIVIFISAELITAQNWQSIGPSGVPSSICISSDYILVGTSNSGIVKSTDDGKNGIMFKVSLLELHLTMLLCVLFMILKTHKSFMPDRTWCNSTGNGFFKSTDGGENWEWKNSGLSWWPAIREISINPFSNNEIYNYCCLNNGVLKFLKVPIMARHGIYFIMVMRMKNFVQLLFLMKKILQLNMLLILTVVFINGKTLFLQYFFKY